MHIFPRSQKFDPNTGQPIDGAFFFGHFHDDPKPLFSVSFAAFEKDYSGEKAHYHTTVEKVYITLEGKGTLGVNGEEVEMNPEEMIHIQPNEIHRVVKVLQSPLKFIAVTSEKVDDKVIVE